MYILFTTDDSVANTGFEIKYWSKGQGTATYTPLKKTGIGILVILIKIN